ncbi:cytochrome C [Cronbergia sp. UHCC 0137]|uniref:cytochrome C n=1 Tax=Cronbergia sp. UHCC 0137 TaxID=3110239 RepID=UPI002B1ECDBD|nr:cytochrome C [Cronbergia sp. UHCC 0137]MEA5617050.1 cytochrome C [Cronbergia sp. UHCC 0137]
MTNLVKRKSRPLGLFLVILGWSLTIGWLLSFATSVQAVDPNSPIGTVDIVPPQYQLAQELYLENCSTCHIAIPPAVFPSQTWNNLVQDSQHYGVQLKPLIDPPRFLVLKYLSTFSRSQLPDEPTPYRFSQSRYLRALHPGVKLPNPISLGSCISCHPGVNEYNFRTLSSEYEQQK